MMVYIVFQVSSNQSILSIESVWSTKALAKAAIHFHAEGSGNSLDNFKIAVRDVNTAQIK